MPAQYGLRANNREGFKNRWKELVELHEEPTVAIGQPRPALRVTPQQPVFTDPNATIAWSGTLMPEFKTDVSLKTFFGRGSGESLQMQWQGDGFVVVQPYEEIYMQHSSS